MDFVTLGIAILVVACAIALSWALSKHFRMADYFGKFTLVLLPLFASLAVVGLRYDQIRLGIDLRGGVVLVYEVVGAAQRGGGTAGPGSDGLLRIATNLLDVPAEVIGKLVMEGLRQIDEVAYVRFASVYRRFQEATDFVQEVRKLGAKE